MSRQEIDAAERADGQPVLFRFAYRSVPFRVVAAADAGAMLLATVGTMPYTVDGPSLRHDVLTLLDGARRVAGYEIAVIRDHGISLSVMLAVDRAEAPERILAAALHQLASTKQWLDRVLSLLPKHLRNVAETRSQDAA